MLCRKDNKNFKRGDAPVLYKINGSTRRAIFVVVHRLCTSTVVTICDAFRETTA